MLWWTLRQLKAGNPEKRRLAIQKLALSQDPRSFEPLLSALNDIDSDVRTATAEALGKIRDVRAVEPLVARLNDERREVRQEVADSLSLFGWQPTNDSQHAWLSVAREEWDEMPGIGETAVEPLVFVIKGDDGEIRRAAAEALAKLGERAIERLIGMLSERFSDVCDEGAVRKVVINVLEQTNISRARQAVTTYRRLEAMHEAALVKEQLEKEVSNLKFKLELAQMRYENAVHILRSLGQPVSSGGKNSEMLDLELQLRALKVALTYYSAKSELSSEIRTFRGHSGFVMSVCLSDDGQHALSAGGKDKNPGELMVWEVATGRCLRKFDGFTDTVSAACLSKDGQLALSAGGDSQANGRLALWEVNTGRQIRTFEGHTEPVQSVALSEDGRYVLSGSAGLGGVGLFKERIEFAPPLRLWEKDTGHCLSTFQNYSALVFAVCFSRDGRHVLTGAGQYPQKGEVILWETETSQSLREFNGHTQWVTSVCLSADGRIALSGSADKTLKLWEVISGRCLHTFEGHTAEVTSVALSNDGLFAISGSNDGTVKLWEVESKQCLLTFKGHLDSVRSVCLSADGKLGISGSNDGMLKLWSMQEQQADAAVDLFSSTPSKEEVDPEVLSHIEALKGEDQQVEDAAFSLMSRRLAVSSQAALPALIEAVKNEMNGATKERNELTKVLFLLLLALQKIGVEDSIPVLLEVMKCEIRAVSFAATKLLEGLAPGTSNQSSAMETGMNFSDSKSHFNQRDIPPPPSPPPLRR